LSGSNALNCFSKNGRRSNQIFGFCHDGGIEGRLFGQVRFDELCGMDDELWQIFSDAKIPKPATGDRRPATGDQLKILCLSWLAVTFRNAHSSFFLARTGMRMRATPPPGDAMTPTIPAAPPALESTPATPKSP
jgi:hypothetical protein